MTTKADKDKLAADEQTVAADQQAVADDISRDNMSTVDETPLLEQPLPLETPVASDHYEGKQQYPKILYHVDHAARKVESPEEHAALEQQAPGWTEAPAPKPAEPTAPDLPGVKA